LFNVPGGMSTVGFSQNDFRWTAFLE
jgi:hypothetical protein